MFTKYRAKKIFYNDKFKECDLKIEGGKNDYFFLYNFAVIELDTSDNLELMYGSIGYDFTWLAGKHPLFFISRAILIGYSI